MLRKLSLSGILMTRHIQAEKDDFPLLDLEVSVFASGR